MRPNSAEYCHRLMLQPPFSQGCWMRHLQAGGNPYSTERTMPSRYMVRNAVILICVSLLITPALGKLEPSTGLIRIISIGECFYPETRLPFMLKADPRIRYQPVPTNWYEGTFTAVGRGREDAERFIRLYLPRTYERFLGQYDVILLSDFEVDIISPTQFVWMERSVREDAMGMGKYEMNFDPAHWHTFDLFRASAVYPAFPAGLVKGREFRGDGIYAVTLKETSRPHPMLDLPNMKNFKVPIDIGTGKAGYEDPRPGSTVVARYVPNDEPAIIIWEYGKGRSMTCVPGHDTIVWGLSEHWPYVVDFWINQAWHLAGLEIPPEVGVLHQLREDSLLYASQRMLATTVIDFVEKFGATTRPLYEKLSGVDAVKKAADRFYRQDEYDQATEKMKEAFEGLRELAEESVRAKEGALFWVFTIEWVVITGTAVLTGLGVWTVMVKRRLYREVDTTRTK